jgi:subtilisin family serine protease
MTDDGAAPSLDTRRGRMTIRTRTRLLAATVLTCGLVGLPGGAAAAAPADDSAASDGGLWYVTRTGVDQAHAQTRGAGVTIGVIDGAVDPGAPDLRGTALTAHQPSFCATSPGATTWASATSTTPAAQHATGMASLLVGTGAGNGTEAGVRGVAPDARVVTYSVLEARADAGAGLATVCPRHAGDERGWLEGAIDAAIADHVDILSVSMTGDVAEPGAIARALHAGIVVVAAQAHGGPTPAYPASSNGVLAVESSGADGTLAAQATVDPANTVVAPGQDVRQPSADLAGYVTESGSSPATAWTAGVLALAWSAHPGATGNQVLQALVRSTAHPGDGWGLGAVDVAGLFAQDPAALPDVNPLVRDGVLPSAAQLASPPPAVAGPSTGSSAPRDGATMSAAKGGRLVAPAGHGRGVSVGLLVGGGVLALVAAVVAGALLARRSPGRGPSVDGTDADPDDVGARR